MTPEEAGMQAPASAMPSPSASSASAHCTGLATRSARLVVATEQEVGCRGMPTAQFFAKVDGDAAKAALVLGHRVVDRIENTHHRRRPGASLREVQTVGHAVGIVPEIDID